MRKQYVVVSHYGWQDLFLVLARHFNALECDGQVTTEPEEMQFYRTEQYGEPGRFTYACKFFQDVGDPYASHLTPTIEGQAPESEKPKIS